MLVPRNTTKPIFYADPDALQMIFDKIVSDGRPTICKAVLLLTSSSKYLYDVWVSVYLPGLTHQDSSIWTREQPSVYRDF